MGNSKKSGDGLKFDDRLFPLYCGGGVQETPGSGAWVSVATEGDYSAVLPHMVEHHDAAVVLDQPPSARTGHDWIAVDHDSVGHNRQLDESGCESDVRRLPHGTCTRRPTWAWHLGTLVLVLSLYRAAENAYVCLSISGLDVCRHPWYTRASCWLGLRQVGSYYARGSCGNSFSPLERGCQSSCRLTWRYTL